MRKKEFELTSIAWDEVQHKLDVEPIETALNSKLNLSDYGSRVRKIFFVFLAIKPEDTLHENRVYFNPDTSTLEIALKLSFSHVVRGTSDEVRRMMAALFLKSIELYDELDLSRYDVDQLGNDVRVVFNNKNWLPT